MSSSKIDDESLHWTKPFTDDVPLWFPHEPQLELPTPLQSKGLRSPLGEPANLYVSRNAPAGKRGSSTAMPRRREETTPARRQVRGTFVKAVLCGSESIRMGKDDA